MWASFFLAVLMGAAFVYVPGYLLIRGLRVSRLASVCLAPFVSVAAFGVLGIVYEKAGIFASWVTVAVPLVVLGAVLCIVRLVAGKRESDRFGLREPDGTIARCAGGRFDWLCLGVYCCLGVALVGYFFVRSLDGAGSFVQEYDNVHHINTVRAFVDSGSWSSLSPTLYSAGEAVPFAGSKGFYPAAWHAVVALVVDSMGVSVPVAGNAVNFVFAALVYPSGMFLLLRSVFSRKPKVVLLGAFCVLAFAAFPWKLLGWGPIYPNFAALALLPAVLFCFMTAIGAGVAVRTRVVSGALFAIGLVALALAQPNAVFTAGVFLVPFCVDRIARQCYGLPAPTVGRKRLRAILWCAVFLAGAAALWAILFNLPFLRDVVTFTWPPFTGKAQAVTNVLLLAFRETSAQIVLGALVALGALYTLHARRYLWVTCSYGIMCFMYVVNASSDGFLKQILTGFWYADPMRLAANLALFAVPLAALGLYCAVCAAKRVYEVFSRKPAVSGRSAFVVSCATVAVFMIANFYPSYTIPGRASVSTAFGQTTDFLTRMYGGDHPVVYDAEEREFVDEALEIVSDGSVVINEPNDGSALAYGISDMNVYYRIMGGHGGSDETEESKLVRERLDAIATDERVASAVEAIGAEYVLLLDQDDRGAENPYFFTYDASDWTGLESIDDDTPGFEVVLSQGDMRLYRIVG